VAPVRLKGLRYEARAAEELYPPRCIRRATVADPASAGRRQTFVTGID
jgi:hypothetical protein